MESDPLSDDELAMLGDFLASSATGDSAMNLSMLDGYLTALASGPNNLPPARWMPVIWGADMAWSHRELAERMIGLVFRHANALLACLRDAPERYRPLLFDHEIDGARVTVLDEWCAGFVAGIELDRPGWGPLLDSAEGVELLRPIMLYGTDAGWETLDTDPVLAARHDEFAAGLGATARRIAQWWLPLRRPTHAGGPRATRGQPGPPCPCGSGRAFAECCGGARILH